MVIAVALDQGLGVLEVAALDEDPASPADEAEPSGARAGVHRIGGVVAEGNDVETDDGQEAALGAVGVDEPGAGLEARPLRGLAVGRDDQRVLGVASGLEPPEALIAPGVTAPEQKEIVVPISDELGAARQRAHRLLRAAPVVGVVPFGADVDHTAVGADVEGREAVLLFARSGPFGPVSRSVAARIVLPVDETVAVVVDAVV